MGIKATTSPAQFKKTLQNEVNKHKQLLLRNLLYCAEAITNKAREAGTYTDRTKNLRSSIGTIVVVDGEIIKQYGFEPLASEAHRGSIEGQEYAKQLAKEYPKGYAIIAVAGKEYASYVADKGYDVLDSAELLARQLVPSILSELKLTQQTK